jgi:hypothetical protein
LGWRIVAVGIFFLILGGSMVFNNTGSTWIGGSMVIFGILAVLVGRRV